jgi:hypothetical protein
MQGSRVFCIRAHAFAMAEFQDIAGQTRGTGGATRVRRPPPTPHFARRQSELTRTLGAAVRLAALPDL